ncbi:MAG: NADH oxidase [Reichenbachiella sp.]
MINDSLRLPCGVVLKNRLAKAAMTERFSYSDLKPNKKHYALYETWANEGAGLLITGNVMVDRTHLESAGNVYGRLDALPQLEKWANMAALNETQCWVQLSHSGRQTNILNNLYPKSASDVKLKKLGFFAKPKALKSNEIEIIIKKFIGAALVCQEAGFSGVQVHAAHGYLISQFLSPVTNLRNDEWGGTIENRSRLLISVVKGIREKVGPNFAISVKLNSSDFQKGGFDEKDSLCVISQLEKLGIDLLEISGGTYEKVEFFMAEDKRASTKAREAYFMDFADKVKAHSKLPLMVTGGISSLGFCNDSLRKGELDVIGMGRPFLLYDNFASRFLSGEITPKRKLNKTGIKSLDDMAEAGFYNLVLDRMGKGKKISLHYSAIRSAFHFIKHEFVKAVGNKF